MSISRTTTYELAGSDGGGAGVLVLRDGSTADLPLAPSLAVTVGRGSSAGIRIDHTSVSRRHAELRWDGATTITVRDLGSHNGTWLDGRRLDGTGLAGSGAQISIGPARLLLYVRTERERSQEPDVVSGDAMMHRALAIADRAACIDSPVLVLGETGTGKELVARRIHARSARARAPFAAVNCGGIPDALAQAELFGHERGAFTGAQGARAGLFERAAGGTVFLDEIGELPLRIQTMLLRVLQERTLVRVGGSAPITLDVRIVAATHRDLDAMAKDGTFRSDLLFRLDVLRIDLPPLRARPADVTLLAERFMRELEPTGRVTLSPEVLARLRAHTWPGNARELRNVLERAILMEPGGLTVRGLTSVIGEAAVNADLGARLSQVERDQLEQALEACDGNRSRAARWLGITRRALVYRLGKYGIGER